MRLVLRPKRPGPDYRRIGGQLAREIGELPLYSSVSLLY
jgi:hypothetical protein